MPIQVLPARLANQIAAGEVVERPASVVKELVENSLDAGATRIDIEIEKGGHKRICIRDNGNGIVKDELCLALSRHATSKIASLDDLEHIVSLGFRGEALASISSVARLTLTSRTAEQTEAWQAECEGRDMQVEVKPAAHPVGTSVEVVDLFFNTPARRKFLRTEKTEFQHIDELLKRIALSRFDVAFSLKHNGKLIRKSPTINDPAARIRRVASVVGSEFADQASEIVSEYQGMKLAGWLATPANARAQNDLQYFYVNGRIMRDKLINHAIRQAYEGVIASDMHPAYVLYLTLDAGEVDVNVHPAKHEVRFHQARLVHDFIYRAITDVLEQSFNDASPGQSGTLDHAASPAVTRLGEVAPEHNYITPLQPVEPPSSGGSASSNGRASGGHVRIGYGASPSPQAAHNYQHLMTAESAARTDSQGLQTFFPGGRYWLVASPDNTWCVDLAVIKSQQLSDVFAGEVPVSQPLLMPVSVDADEKGIVRAQALYEPLLALSTEIGWAGKRILLRKVPAGMRQYPWIRILPALLECESSDSEDIRQHFLFCLTAFDNDYTLPQAQTLWQQWLNQQGPDWQEHIHQVARVVPLAEWLETLHAKR